MHIYTKEHLLNAARPGNWIYNSSVVTDQNPHEMAIAIVREKLLDFLTDELPYTIQVSIRMWDVDSLGIKDFKQQARLRVLNYIYLQEL